MGFFATHVVPTVLYVLKKLTFPLSLFAMLAPAPQDVVDKNVDAMAAAANSETLAPMRSRSFRKSLKPLPKRELDS